MKTSQLLLAVKEHSQHRHKLRKLSLLSHLHILAQQLHQHCMSNLNFSKVLAGPSLQALLLCAASLREYKLNAQRLCLSR